VADPLLELWVRIPPGLWMFVLCVLYSKGQNAQPVQSGQRSSTDEVKRTIVSHRPARMNAYCELFFVRLRSVRRADPSSRGVLPIVACHCELEIPKIRRP
jgi:hypothetical protein